MKIGVDELQAEIVQAVADYTEDVTKGIEKEILRAATKTVKDVKANSPVKSGEYKSGWTRRKIKTDGKIGYIIYNKKRGPLVHLLEFGFTPRNSRFRVAGRPHLRPAADKNIKEMLENIERIIERGG